MAVCGLSLRRGSSESCKTLEQKFLFQIGTLNPHVIHERFSFTNLFLFSRHHTPTNSVTPLSAYKPTHDQQFLQFYSLRWPIYVFNPVVNTKSKAKEACLHYRHCPRFRIEWVYYNLSFSCQYLFMIGCLYQCDTGLPAVGNCSFMNYYCSLRNYESTFFKALKEGTSSDCG